MNYDKMIEELAKSAYAFSIPIDFEKLISDGLLKKIGHSYYVDNIGSLPESISIRIKSISHTKRGIRVTFCKESKRMKELSKNIRRYCPNKTEIDTKVY